MLALGHSLLVQLVCSKTNYQNALMLPLYIYLISPMGEDKRHPCYGLAFDVLLQVTVLSLALAHCQAIQSG
jgi:hypothetical protein